MLALARRAEDLGYRSLWTFQRLLHPAPDDAPPAWSDGVAASNPGARPADDAAYRAVHDPLLPLALVAGHTTRIRLGTATVCAPFLAPPVLAKAALTLDRLSQGRFTLGVGIGWMPHEYVATGVPETERGARMEEYLQTLHALWAADADRPAGFEGRFYRVPPSSPGLAPVQRPHPPVLVGGTAPAALRRAGRLADGWIAHSRHRPDDIADGARLVRAAARDAGRDPDAVTVLVRAIVDLTARSLPASRPFLHGDAAQVRGDLARLYERGATEVFVDLNFHPRVGSPDVPATAATSYAEEVLAALAPAAG